MKLFNQKCSYFDKRILKCMTVGFWGGFLGDTVYSVHVLNVHWKNEAYFEY